MTFTDLRREVFLLLRFYAGTLRLFRRDEGAFVLCIYELIEDLCNTLRAYTAERSIRADVLAEFERRGGEDAVFLADVRRAKILEPLRREVLEEVDR
jgi:hypothetical protein